MRVRVRAQNRRGASGANRACDSVLDRLSLRRPGRDGEQLRPRHQRWYRQRQCVSRHFVERSKGAVVDLLVSTNLVELDHLDGFGIVEVTKRRIDESEMTVLADAEDGEIGRVLLRCWFRQISSSWTTLTGSGSLKSQNGGSMKAR